MSCLSSPGAAKITGLTDSDLTTFLSGPMRAHAFSAADRCGVDVLYVPVDLKSVMYGIVALVVTVELYLLEEVLDMVIDELGLVILVDVLVKVGVDMLLVDVRRCGGGLCSTLNSLCLPVAVQAEV